MVAQIFGILQSLIIPLPKYMFGRQSIYLVARRSRHERPARHHHAGDQLNWVGSGSTCD
jgi:hypothetical protein